MDDLERVAAQNHQLRAQELQRAEEIVREELAAYARAAQERVAVPVLARLRAHAQALAEAEAERTLAALGPLDDRQCKSIRAMAVAIVNKLLHGPTQRLRGEQGGPLAEAAAELFGIPDATQPPGAGSQSPSAGPGSEPPAAGRQPPADREEGGSREADVLSILGRK